MRLKIRAVALALAAMLVLPVLLPPPLPVSAQTASGLYGTGSADELNIIKLIDMALNRGGMSMSPSTVRAFLDFWWSSVQSDLDACIKNAGSAATTTQAFADYVVSALEDADHYDKLGSIIVKYVQYCVTLGVQSVSDFAQLLLQPGTFRRFLLSYVTDGDGNIANTVDNKIKRYSLKSGLVNMVRQAADVYVEEHEGYYLVRSHKVGDIDPVWFSSRESYDALVGSVKHNLPLGRYGYGYDGSCKQFFCVCLDGWNFVYSSGDGSMDSFKSGSMLGLRMYSDKWSDWGNGGRPVYFSADKSRHIYMDGETVTAKSYYSFLKYMYSSFGAVSNITSYNCPQIMIFTEKGDFFKVWKSLDALKGYTVGKQNIYYTNNYSSYDSSADNSIEFTGSYYNSTSNTYSHDVIQNTIDNSQETINDTTINNITNETINNITNNYGSGSGSGGGGSDGPDNWWNIGDGISAVIKGVAELLDFVLKLLGDLVGLLGRFLTEVLEVFKSLGVVGSGFGEFLKEVFGFLPEECISLIVSSIGAMCVVGIIKIFKK